MKFAALFLLPLLTVCAQPLMVYSEFARIDAGGKVLSPAEPREILSPAIARNAFTSFQVIVQPSGNTPWQLYVAQNPENAVDVTLYRETGERLERVTQPVSGTGTAVFWMDLWAKRTAPVERIKVEPQLHIDNDWVIYPMEARVMDAQVPDAPEGGWPAGTAAPGDVMTNFLCEKPLNAGPAPKEPTLASLRFRNAQQDRALARRASKTALERALGSCEATPPADNPEWYFGIRDYLFRQP